MKLLSRKEAMKLNSKTYFTGSPCKKGHIDIRYVKGCKCYSCSKLSCRNFYNNNLEYNKNRRAKYYEDNIEVLREYARKYYHDNINDIRNKRKHCNLSEEVRIRAVNRSRKYSILNPEVKSTAERNRRARKRNSQGKHNRADIYKLIQSQNNKCASCKTKIKDKYNVDHIMPLKLGGSNDYKNLQILCVRCNAQKSAKHPIDWAIENGRLC